MKLFARWKLGTGLVKQQSTPPIEERASRCRRGEASSHRWKGPALGRRAAMASCRCRPAASERKVLLCADSRRDGRTRPVLWYEAGSRRWSRADLVQAIQQDEQRVLVYELSVSARSAALPRRRYDRAGGSRRLQAARSRREGCRPTGSRRRRELKAGRALSSGRRGGSRGTPRRAPPGAPDRSNRRPRNPSPAWRRETTVAPTLISTRPKNTARAAEFHQRKERPSLGSDLLTIGRDDTQAKTGRQGALGKGARSKCPDG